MKKYSILLSLGALCAQSVFAATPATTRMGGNVVGIYPYANGAVRIVVGEKAANLPADDLFYVKAADGSVTATDEGDTFVADCGAVSVLCNRASGDIYVVDTFSDTITSCKVSGVPASQNAKVVFATKPGERIYGTGQFQDGHLDVNGLSRRLTQVNTQIAMPMVISSKGYGVLWNNYGITDFNPADSVLVLQPAGDTGESEEVNVTGTSGNRREQRAYGVFAGDITVDQQGRYALLLDVGQSMARRHNLSVDGVKVCDARNIWLPPTNAMIVELAPGKHHIVVEGENNDKPTVAWRKIDDTMTFSSPVAESVDFTVFTGNADNIIDQYRQLTGAVPQLPAWGLGYIHCRERFFSQNDLLDNANEFRRRNIPVDIMVQDWQYWGKYGWNAMRFDEEYYPDPKAMTDSLHNMDMRLMVSVWAKVDRNSELGKQMAANGYYIDDRCDWIDFFNPDAADAYIKAYNANLLPAGIDAWWQDATEPENDDLHGRRVNKGTVDGDVYRNVFPLKVNDCVYNGMLEARPDARQMILTRSAAPGIQRYGIATWSGDVGNDYQTMRYQINGGLGQMATGLPWWTYDAGGFFRPGDQHTNDTYQQCMLRWIETSVFLPLMRVHGYQSQTEPWRYSEATCKSFAESIGLRYSLLPYIYSEAMRVSTANSTLMRPLVFDFADDEQALAAAENKCMYMFGPSLLVCPVTEADCNVLNVYLPKTEGGWYDFHRGLYHAPGAMVAKSADRIPVFVRAGSIIPRSEQPNVRSSADALNTDTLTICVYPGADGSFTLWEDDGVSTNDAHSEIDFVWDDHSRRLTVGARRGHFDAMPQQRMFNVKLPNGSVTPLQYKGKKTSITLK